MKFIKVDRTEVPESMHAAVLHSFLLSKELVLKFNLVRTILKVSPVPQRNP